MSTTLSERREHIVRAVSALSHCAANTWPHFPRSSCSRPVVRCKRLTLDQASFQGMSALASAATEERPLEVLIIHGMGTPAPYQFEGFHPVDRAAASPRSGPVRTLGTTEFQLLSDGPGICGPLSSHANADQHYRGCSGRRSRCSSTPIVLVPAPTDRSRLRLTLSSLGAPDRTHQMRSCQGRRQAPPKQAFANFARDFIDNKLGDVVLYGGTFRDNVDASVGSGRALPCDRRKPKRRRQDVPTGLLQRPDGHHHSQPWRLHADGRDR